MFLCGEYSTAVRNPLKLLAERTADCASSESFVSVLSVFINFELPRRLVTS